MYSLQAASSNPQEHQPRPPGGWAAKLPTALPSPVSLLGQQRLLREGPLPAVEHHIGGVLPQALPVGRLQRLSCLQQQQTGKTARQRCDVATKSAASASARVCLFYVELLEAAVASGLKGSRVKPVFQTSS